MQQDNKWRGPQESAFGRVWGIAIVALKGPVDQSCPTQEQRHKNHPEDETRCEEGKTHHLRRPGTPNGEAEGPAASRLPRTLVRREPLYLIPESLVLIVTRKRVPWQDEV